MSWFLLFIVLILIPFLLDSLSVAKTSEEKNEELVREVEAELYSKTSSKSTKSPGISSRTLFFRVCMIVCAAFGLLFLIA